MKKNRLRIDVPGKYSEDRDSDRDSDRDEGVMCDSVNGNGSETESHGVGKIVNASCSSTNMLMPVLPEIAEMTIPSFQLVKRVSVSENDKKGPEMTQQNVYNDTNQLAGIYTDNGFVNNQDYSEIMAPEDMNYITEPRLINPQNYSPIIYALNPQKPACEYGQSVQTYRQTFPIGYEDDMMAGGIGESMCARKPSKERCVLPYLFVNKDSITDIRFGIRQNKMKLYNYWITTDNCMSVKAMIVGMFGADDVYVTKSFFFKKNNSYSGQKVILITQIPQRPYKFINKLNRKMSVEKRTVKSVNGDYLISCDCMLIILSNYSIDYICSNYYKYHKNEATQITTLLNSLKTKFTCLEGKDL